MSIIIRITRQVLSPVNMGILIQIDSDWLYLHKDILDSNPDSDHLSHVDCIMIRIRVWIQDRTLVTFRFYSHFVFCGGNCPLLRGPPQ